MIRPRMASVYGWNVANEGRFRAKNVVYFNKSHEDECAQMKLSILPALCYNQAIGPAQDVTSRPGLGVVKT